MSMLARASLKNRALIVLITIVAALFGTIGVGQLKQELMPSVQFPMIAVVTTYPGATPEVVNNDVSEPIETAMRGVPQLKSTSATSSTNSSMVLAEFDYGVDLASTEQKVERAISRLGDRLPETADTQVVSGSIDDFPVIQVAVTPADGDDPEDTAARVNDVLVPKIEDIDGIREAQLQGARGDRVTITVDKDKLEDAGLSTQSIKDSLQQNGVLMPAGSVTEDGDTLALQAGSQVTSVDTINKLPVVPDPQTLAQQQQQAMQAQAQEQQMQQQAEAGGIAQYGEFATDEIPQDDAAVDAEAVPEPEPEPLEVTTIADVAEVKIEQNPETSISRVDGAPALTLAITKMSSANTVEISHAVLDVLDEQEAALEGASLHVVFDQAPYIEDSVETLTTEGLLGLAFAVLVILVFLFSFRSTLVTAISIPTSVLLTLIALWATDYTLNMLTLGALTISIGRVVDDSIVVIENIQRHLQPGVDRIKTIVFAVKEVAGAITSSTIATIAVFLPIAFVGGMVGELFRPFSFTLSFAFAASLLVSLTIVPVLASWFIHPKGETRNDRKRLKAAKRAAAAQADSDKADSDVTTGASSDAVTSLTEEDSAAPSGTIAGAEIAHATDAAETSETVDTAAAAKREGLEKDEKPTRIQRVYLPVIHWTLRRPVITLLAAVVVFAGTLAATPFMKTNFIGDDGQNAVGLTQTLSPGASLETQLGEAEKVESALKDVKEVESVQVSIGAGGGMAVFGSGGDGVVTYSITTDENADQVAVQDKVRDAVADLDGEFSIGQSGGGMTMSNEIEVAVTAPDAKTLQEANDNMVAELKKTDGLIQVESNLATSRPYVSITVDRDKAAEAGLSEAAVSGMISAAMDPQEIGSIEIDEQNTSIYLSEGDAPSDIDGVKALTVQTMLGEKRVDELATVEQSDGPISISTANGVRQASVTMLPDGDNLSAASVAVQEALDSVELPAGATADIGGVLSDQGDAFTQLGLALLAAILIVYVIMVATFKSLLQPLLLLISVPFAATGALLLLIATGIPLGIASLIGMLMLVGIVVTNAIVLVDLINQYRERGWALRESVEAGASHRVRPIVMTALATIFALIPMASGVTGQGGFISQPLAVVVIGGLLSSTVLTLVVLPTLYYSVERLREKRRERRERKRNEKAAQRAVVVGE